MEPEMNATQVSYGVMCGTRFLDDTIERAFDSELDAITKNPLVESYPEALRIFRQIDELIERYLDGGGQLFGFLVMFEVTPTVDLDVGMAMHLMTFDNGVSIHRARYFWPRDASRVEG